MISSVQPDRENPLPVPRIPTSMTQARVIRFLIVGLPLGLIAGGVIAMKAYFREQSNPSTGFGYTRKAVSRTDIQSHVERLAKTIGPRAAGMRDRVKFAVNYLQSTLSPANMGFNVSQQTYKVDGENVYNLVIEIPGTHPDHLGEIVLAGANYDSVADSPGADANASGVAACLSLCQAFANTKHERTLRFVFFANGETEDKGSAHYARECKQRGEKIVAMMSLNSLGYYTTAPAALRKPLTQATTPPESGDFLAVFGDANGKGLVETFTSQFKKDSTLPLSGTVLPENGRAPGSGDERSFAEQGYPAVVVTDTAELRNPNYHQPGDTPETLDYERLTQAVQGIEAVLRVLANPVRAGER